MFQTYSAFVNYNNSFADHTIGLMLGMTGEKSHYEKNYGYRKNMTVDDLDDINLGDATTAEATGGSNEVGMISYLSPKSFFHRV